MAKLSLVQRLSNISPLASSKQKRELKSLLNKHDGPSSDGLGKNGNGRGGRNGKIGKGGKGGNYDEDGSYGDDDSSSLSEVQDWNGMVGMNDMNGSLNSLNSLDDDGGHDECENGSIKKGPQHKERNKSDANKSISFSTPRDANNSKNPHAFNDADDDDDDNLSQASSSTIGLQWLQWQLQTKSTRQHKSWKEGNGTNDKEKMKGIKSFFRKKSSGAHNEKKINRMDSNLSEDGYESDNSFGSSRSTRSTSSSFLRYQSQSRSKWKNKLNSMANNVANVANNVTNNGGGNEHMAKNVKRNLGGRSQVMELRGDGTEVPVSQVKPIHQGQDTISNADAVHANDAKNANNVNTSNNAHDANEASNMTAKPWPIFDKIYKRQNQLLKKGEVGEDGQVNDSFDDDEDDSDNVDEADDVDEIDDQSLDKAEERNVVDAEEIEEVDHIDEAEEADEADDQKVNIVDIEDGLAGSMEENTDDKATNEKDTVNKEEEPKEPDAKCLTGDTLNNYHVSHDNQANNVNRVIEEDSFIGVIDAHATEGDNTNLSILMPQSCEDRNDATSSHASNSSHALNAPHPADGPFDASKEKDGLGNDNREYAAEEEAIDNDHATTQPSGIPTCEMTPEEKKKRTTINSLSVTIAPSVNEISSSSGHTGTSVAIAEVAATPTSIQSTHSAQSSKSAQSAQTAQSAQSAQSSQAPTPPHLQTWSNDTSPTSSNDSPQLSSFVAANVIGDSCKSSVIEASRSVGGVNELHPPAQKLFTVPMNDFSEGDSPQHSKPSLSKEQLEGSNASQRPNPNTSLMGGALKENSFLLANALKKDSKPKNNKSKKTKTKSSKSTKSTKRNQLTTPQSLTTVQSHHSLQTLGILMPTSIPKTICYSLRTAIGDGSTRQRNSHSLMERRILRPNGSHVDVSYWSHRGKRNYMEDRFVIEYLGTTNARKNNFMNAENADCPESPEYIKPTAHALQLATSMSNTPSVSSVSSMPITYLAVFDGHGGPAASQFCSDWLSSYVRKNDHFPWDMKRAMKDAFLKIDNDFTSTGHLDGSTACACAILGHRKIICSNAGDSRAIVIKRDGSFVALSEDHKPGRNDETKRINDAGGRVIYWGRWRVEGVLAVSRSIGDARLKPYVTAEPDVVEYDIGEDDLFLVVASDGVWDTMTSDLVAKFVLVNTCKIANKKLQIDGTLLRWIARQISKRARENGSSDNISCIVANLQSCPRP